jgi:hypothetical protein
VTSALGWRDGNRLTLTADAGVVTARREPGRHGDPAGPRLHRDPAPLRRCGLLPGDRVLLAAVPGDDTLTAYLRAVVDQAIRARGAFPHVQGEQA